MKTSTKTVKTMKRKARTCNDKFCEDELYDDLKDLAKLRHKEWNWNAEDYTKQRRSQAPCQKGIVVHKEVLKIILKYCPLGFLGQVPLRSVWQRLDSDFKINDSKEPSQWVWANDSCDRWRMMLKHLVSLKENPTASLLPEIVELCSLVGNREAAQAPPSPAPLPAPPLSELRRCDALQWPDFEAFEGEDELPATAVGNDAKEPPEAAGGKDAGSDVFVADGPPTPEQVTIF